MPIEAFKLIAKEHQREKLTIMGFCPDGALEKYRTLAGDYPRIEYIKPGWMEDRTAQIGLAGRIRVQNTFAEKAYVEVFHTMSEEVPGSPAVAD